jgi:serine/threonine protein kinase
MSGAARQTEIKPSNRIQQILDLAKRGRFKSLDNKLEKLLANPYALAEHQEKIEELYREDKDSDGRYFNSFAPAPCRKLLRGAFGFFLFANAAEEFASVPSDKEDEARKKPNKYLEDSSTLAFIFKKYRIPSKYRGVKLSLHKTGTTSYILKFRWEGTDHALKIVKFYYLDNQLIANNTEIYDDQFNITGLNPKYTPKVIESKESFIIMEYIEGKSLRDFINDDLWLKDGLNLKDVSKIISNLCTILAHYAEKEVPHLDLSPENILIRDKEAGEEDKINIVLIDFGYNYLLNEKVGSLTAAAKRAQLYIAPEIQEDTQTNIRRLPFEKKRLADVYSLGMIILEMLSKKRGRNASKFEGLDKTEAIEACRKKYPGLGDILEDITASNAEIRLFDVPLPSETYTYIKSRINIELQIYEDVYLKDSPRKRWWASLFRFVQIIKDPTDILLRQLEKSEYLVASMFEGTDRAGKIRFWSFWCQYINMFVIVITYVLAGLFISQGTIDENWPRLLVGFSFSLLATQYYMNIFSSLSTIEIQRQIERVKDKGIYSAYESGNRWAYRCEKSFRLNSCYFGGLILLCYLTPLSFWVFPRLWPFLTFIACLFTVANNYFSYRFGLAAKTLIMEQLGSERVPPSMEKFLKDIKIWWVVFLIYAFGPLIIGVLLALGWANDEPVYAIIIVLLNFITLKRNCSGSKAEDIRVELERAINGYSKALRYIEYKEKNNNLSLKEVRVISS